METLCETILAAIHANHEAQKAVEKQIEVVVRERFKNRQKAASLEIPLTCMVNRGNSEMDQSGRLWTRNFFVDKHGGMPEPNEDSKLRFRLEAEVLANHRSPLWNKREIEHLHDIVKNECSSLISVATNDLADSISSVDFEKVANRLYKKTKIRRTAEECQVKYQPNRTPFSKDETLELLRKFHNGDELSLPHRTRWQAFKAFHAAANIRNVPWTLEQDRVLFKTIAAAGPQQPVSVSFASQLSNVLQKPPKVILQRTMTSLLNPNFINDSWSEDDERKLCLLMKVYRDSPNPIALATSHFPNRSSRSVHDKWSRTLIPSYEVGKAFTPDEDARLLQLKGCVDWKLVEKDFPGRLSQSLAHRWKELASKEMVLEEKSRSLKRKFKDFDQNDVVLRVKPNSILKKAV